MASNPWSGVIPMKPHEAELEIGFLLLDAAQDPDAEPLAYANKLVKVINGVYLAGWRDARDEVYKAMLAAE